MGTMSHKVLFSTVVCLELMGQQVFWFLLSQKNWNVELSGVSSLWFLFTKD